MDEQKDDGRKRYREFKVTPGLRGFKVVIGCCEVYFDSVQELGQAINSYLYDPQGTEEKMLANDQRYGMSGAAGMPQPVVPGPTISLGPGQHYASSATLVR